MGRWWKLEFDIVECLIGGWAFERANNEQAFSVGWISIAPYLQHFSVNVVDRLKLGSSLMYFLAVVELQSIC